MLPSVSLKFWIWDPRINLKSWVFFRSMPQVFFSKVDPWRHSKRNSASNHRQMRKSWTRKNPNELRENRQKMELKMHHLCEFGADTWRSEHCWNLLCFRLKCSTFLPHSKGSLDFFGIFSCCRIPKCWNVYETSSKSRKNWILHPWLFHYLKVMRSQNFLKISQNPPKS